MACAASFGGGFDGFDLRIVGRRPADRRLREFLQPAADDFQIDEHGRRRLIAVFRIERSSPC